LIFPNLRALETLLAIERLGSFVATARKLNTTQPTVSMRIRELERQLGVRLIERERNHAKLTQRGLECAHYAERILALSSHLVHDVADSKAYSGRIRIGVSESVALTWLPQLVCKIQDDYPNVVLEIDVDLTFTLWRKLESGNYDLIMVPGQILSLGAYVEPLGRLASI
jgi:DNA-binding transcriptional LysR family regulator